MKKTHIFFALALPLVLTACVEQKKPSSDRIQARQQEVILKEGTSQVGMPAIKNFRERRLLKMILEKRDQEGLVTYTYNVAQATGKLVFLCNSIGYPINDATGFTNPMKIEEYRHEVGYAIMPQAEPNGLYTPDASNDKWVMCVDPKSGQASPVLAGGDIFTSPFPLI